MSRPAVSHLFGGAWELAAAGLIGSELVVAWRGRGTSPRTSTLASHIGIALRRIEDAEDRFPVTEVAVFTGLAVNFWHAASVSARGLGLVSSLVGLAEIDHVLYGSFRGFLLQSTICANRCGRDCDGTVKRERSWSGV